MRNRIRSTLRAVLLASAAFACFSLASPAQAADE